MTYIADPANPALPLDSDDASGGAAELRALKGYLQGLISGGASFESYAWQGFRNRARNGDITINQRNVSSGGIVPTANGILVDGFAHYMSQASKMRVSLQPVGSISTGPIGAANWYRISTEAAVVAPAATDSFSFGLPIENKFVYDLAQGTAGARPIAVSFWVRSSLTGTFSAVLYNQVSARGYTFTFTIAAANTPQFVSTVIPGDTSGTPMTLGASVVGLNLRFNVGAGANFQTGTANTWQAGFFPKLAGSIDIINTLSASLDVSQVQIEPDRVTAFEVLFPDVQKRWNQRYFWRRASTLALEYICIGQCFSTNLAGAILRLPVEMCQPPGLVSLAGSFTLRTANGGSVAISSLNSSEPAIDSVNLNFTVAAATLAQGDATQFRSNAVGTAIDISAELF